MLRYSGCPKGALASFTCVPTYPSSAVRRRYATPTCHSPAPMKLFRCPPKLGDVKRTGIQPCPNASGGAARMPATMPSAARHRRCKVRSEEHTSELQSLAYLVCRLLLEKKKKKQESKDINKQQ